MSEMGEKRHICHAVRVKRFVVLMSPTVWFFLSLGWRWPQKTLLKADNLTLLGITTKVLYIQTKNLTIVGILHNMF